LPGKKIYVADALSRTKIEETMLTDNFEENIPVCPFEEYYEGIMISVRSLQRSEGDFSTP